jgi:hypothetical protein
MKQHKVVGRREVEEEYGLGTLYACVNMP